VFYRSNLYRKDNPHPAIGNAAETSRAPDAAFELVLPLGSLWDHSFAGPGDSVAGRFRDACGRCVAWLIGLPRRAGARMHAMTDAEAQWRHWDVTERHGGLTHQYRDVRFAALRYNPEIRRGELRADLAGPDPAPPDCPCPGVL
jgi:hypothetical protein